MLSENWEKNLQNWASDLGFQQVGITEIQLTADYSHLLRWLERGDHAGMEWIARGAAWRKDGNAVLPNAIRAVTVRLDCLADRLENTNEILKNPNQAYIARYALGRDYHKVLRQKLKKLAEKMAESYAPYGYRVCVDSAPVLEKALARDAGLGWIGKNTLLINKNAGSWFLLGEILTDAPLPLSNNFQNNISKNHCGSCTQCLTLCPTDAFRAPYQLDARKCISYWTIEHKGSIPEDMRVAMGNRVFGCDDCQLVCPWNKFAKRTREADFAIRANLAQVSLLDLWAWTEADYLRHTEGMALRRVGWLGWRRNLAIGLGNAPYSLEILNNLNHAQDQDEMVREHIAWAIGRQGNA